ncbi:hypothetical protein H1R20_g7315, partial [Candolleomyces eurysporus]
MIKAGYEKYKGSLFKVPTFETSSGWLVVAAGQDVANEIRKASEDHFDATQTVIDLLQMAHTFGEDVCKAEAYHVDVTRRQLTKNIETLFPEVFDELKAAFNDHLPQTEDWVSYPTMDTFVHIICRISNRFFFSDLPLCKALLPYSLHRRTDICSGRNEEFLKLQEGFTTQVFLAATAISLVPEPLRPLFGRLLSRVPRATRILKEMFGAIIQERIQKDDELGKDWEGRPNDLISWLLESVPEKQRNIDDLVTRIMFMEFGALHTTTITISDALFNLSVHREHIGPLRAEAEEAIAQYGWSREACNKMVKLDSFMKESSRLAGLNSVYLIRKVQKDFTFSNGVTVPAGYTVGCVSHAAQHDSSLYDNSGEFDGFRFCKAESDVNSTKSMTSPDPKFFLFGSGRHMCPGRYFATAEIKAMLAYILINYDFRLPDDSKTIPEGQWFSSQRSAHTTAKIQLRKRRT